MNTLFDETIGMLSSMLDYQSRRHTVIASNIANIDTPSYRPKELVFKKELDEVMNGDGIKMVKSNGKHLPGKGGAGESNAIEVISSDRKVNIDQEMGRLAENHLMYNLTVELLARKFTSLEYVLREVK